MRHRRQLPGMDDMSIQYFTWGTYTHSKIPQYLTFVLLYDYDMEEWRCLGLEIRKAWW